MAIEEERMRGGRASSGHAHQAQTSSFRHWAISEGRDSRRLLASMHLRRPTRLPMARGMVRRRLLVRISHPMEGASAVSGMCTMALLLRPSMYRDGRVPRTTGSSVKLHPKTCQGFFV